MHTLLLFCALLCAPCWAMYNYPPPSNKTEVQVNMFVLSVEYVSSVDMSYKMQAYFRQRWNDPSLRYTSSEQYRNIDPEKIWTPDLFFTNELSSSTHDLMNDNAFVKVSPNGDVLFSRRVTLVLSCPMNLQAFPFDKQLCTLDIESYGNTVRTLNITWTEPTPVTVSLEAAWSDFSLQQVTPKSQIVVLPSGTYARLSVHFDLHRIPNHYYMTCFIPVALLVTISFLSFWINSSTNRIILLMFTLVAAGVRISAITESLPRTSYAKSIDFYTGFSLTFIFAALVEFVVVQCRYKRDVEHDKVHTTMSDIEVNCFDRILRYVMPILFVGFVTIYFLI